MDTVLKHASETFIVAFRYTNRLPSGAALVSGVALASQLRNQLGTTMSTTLANASLAGATTLSLTADVGAGARLIIGTGLTREVVKVTAIAGDGPYTATLLSALVYAHPLAEAVVYEPGVSASLLADTDATIVSDRAEVTIQGGVHGEEYRLSMVVTLDNANVLEDEARLLVRES